MLNTTNKIDKSILRSIRNKKTSNKVSDVFSCLTSPIENKEYKIVKKEKTNPLALQQFFKLKGLYESGRLVKQKKLKKLVSLYKLLNQTIPKELKEYDTTNPKRNLKHRKNRYIETKAKRIPRKYSLYIESRFWEERKNRYYQTHSRRCAICGSYDKISIHHLNYNNKEFGNEKDDDLVALCWSCHKEFHDEYGVKKNSHKDFAIFASSKTNNPFVD